MSFSKAIVGQDIDLDNFVSARCPGCGIQLASGDEAWINEYSETWGCTKQCADPKGQRYVRAIRLSKRKQKG